MYIHAHVHVQLAVDGIIKNAYFFNDMQLCSVPSLLQEGEADHVRERISILENNLDKVKYELQQKVSLH